ncbi:MAG: hypothetical protein RL235_420 [Chlamydiota bacterium]|jgi:hypothetical protein
MSTQLRAILARPYSTEELVAYLSDQDLVISDQA